MGFKKTIENQRDSDRSKYDAGLQNTKDQETWFKDLNEATSFWKTLWKGEGTGNNEAEWLEEIREGIREKVPDQSDDCFELSNDRAAKVINKKRNWSAPGPDRIANFWWKKTNPLYEGVSRRFRP